MRTTVPAGAARTFTAAQLEAGADGLDGALGDGRGKWRLIVESGQPLVVMSLLKSPTGHLTNLSTPGPGNASRTFKDELAGGGEGPEMVALPRGAFRMGCRWATRFWCAFYDQWPPREVAMTHRFALSTHEVSFADWDACAAAGACRHARDRGWGRGDRPVIDVSWDDAGEYTAWLSEATGEAYRLPSEAEWEYAARAGSTARYSWGVDRGWRRANFPNSGSDWDLRRTAPVGSFTPNPWGLHDMHGNVEEWVEDCWNPDYQGAPTDGTAWTTGDCELRSVRGGHWYIDSSYAASARRAARSRGLADRTRGFRVARDTIIEDPSADDH